MTEGKDSIEKTTSNPLSIIIHIETHLTIAMVIPSLVLLLSRIMLGVSVVA
jgi:hypothetical protein